MFLMYSHVDKRFPSSTKVEFIFAPQRPGDNNITEASGKFVHDGTYLNTHAHTHTLTHTHTHVHYGG